MRLRRRSAQAPAHAGPPRRRQPLVADFTAAASATRSSCAPPTLCWHCSHQSPPPCYRHAGGAALERGDLPRAMRAAELRLALPLDPEGAATHGSTSRAARAARLARRPALVRLMQPRRGWRPGPPTLWSPSVSSTRGRTCHASGARLAAVAVSAIAAAAILAVTAEAAPSPRRPTPASPPPVPRPRRRVRRRPARRRFAAAFFLTSAHRQRQARRVRLHLHADEQRAGLCTTAATFSDGSIYLGADRGGPAGPRAADHQRHQRLTGGRTLISTTPGRAASTPGGVYDFAESGRPVEQPARRRAPRPRTSTAPRG